MINKNQYIIVMAGGAGTRLWPFSRNNYPKQFHDILGVGKTLIQQTCDRFKDICPVENIFVVTNADYRTLVKTQLPYLSDEQILLEPVKRNTAPCIAYACYKIALKNPKANIVVAPSDQIILQNDNFQSIIKKALKSTAKNDILITLGIKPHRPDTGYGYIQFYEESQENLTKDIKKVKLFTEKPELDLAQKFLDSGDFVWNAGIFVWNVQSILQAFKKYLPEISEIFEEAQTSFYTVGEEKIVKNAYYQCKNISIDYGIMESAENVYVILADFDWSDLGTWSSVFETSTKDEHNNAIVGNVITYKTENCVIKTPKDRLLIVEGLENYIIAEYDNVLLICKMDDDQKIRDFVIDAKNKGGEFI